jgi:hypothetical protein
MADAVFGGGGSVRWALHVDDDERDDPDKKTTFTSRARGCKCKGVDKNHSDDFMIAVRVPNIANRHEFIEWLLDERQGNLYVRGGAARFRLPIRDDDEKQITVRWK